ncbi:MAG: sugar phosphate nucleotidyltransferase [Promethearchaeota archaeon]
MQVKDLPVVMLAAGMSKRFNPEHRFTHKSLLKIDNENRIFDLILNGLTQNAILQVFVLLGYKSKEFKQYLCSDKFFNMKNLRLNSILARDDYVKGPTYTLLSLIPELDENMNDFVIIPSDTIFHPSILKQVLSHEIDRSQNHCILFSVQLSETSISQINQNIVFSPNLIDESSKLHNLLDKGTSPYMKEFYIPILVLSRSFLKFINDPESRISGKIIHNLDKYYEYTGNCHVIRLKYDLDIPPFLDIDTSHIYNTLIRVKKELLEPYKVK